MQIVEGNGRYYGSALPVADDAPKRGRQGEKSSVEALRAMEFEIRTNPPLPLNVDREIWGQTPAHSRVVPRALEVFAPAAPE